MNVRPDDLGKAAALRIEAQQFALVYCRNDSPQKRTGIRIVNAALLSVSVSRRCEFADKLLQRRFLADR